MASIGVAGAAMTPSIASADDSGPTVYLSRHGLPTLCSINVDAAGVDSSDKPLSSSHYFARDSCDGTLHLPKAPRGFTSMGQRALAMRITTQSMSTYTTYATIKLTACLQVLRVK